MQTEELIQTLIEQTRQILNQAERLKQESLTTLQWRPAPTAWSALECLEHLNLYGDYYLPELEHAIAQSQTKPDAVFKTGLLGDYFAKSMLPKDKLSKMKTLKNKNPLHATLDRGTIEKFIQQQIKMINLLQASRSVSLNKVKISISIARFIKLKLGDTFRFVINHNIRHMKQAENVMSAHQELAVSNRASQF